MWKYFWKKNVVNFFFSKSASTYGKNCRKNWSILLNLLMNVFLHTFQMILRKKNVERKKFGKEFFFVYSLRPLNPPLRGGQSPPHHRPGLCPWTPWPRMCWDWIPKPTVHRILLLVNVSGIGKIKIFVKQKNIFKNRIFFVLEHCASLKTTKKIGLHRGSACRSLGQGRIGLRKLRNDNRFKLCYNIVKSRYFLKKLKFSVWESSGWTVVRIVGWELVCMVWI